MSNMSYCRFENTLADLRDCYSAISEGAVDELSDSEREAFERLLLLCKRMAGDFEDEIEEIEAQRARERQARMNKVIAERGAKEKP